MSKLPHQVGNDLSPHALITEENELFISLICMSCTLRFAFIHHSYNHAFRLLCSPLAFKWIQVDQAFMEQSPSSCLAALPSQPVEV